VRIADSIRRGKVVSQQLGTDLFEVDYHALAALPVGEVRERLHVPVKGDAALGAGSVGPFVPEGMSETQRRAMASRRGGEA
jgi:hypothetical protein